ncbi:MAG: MFS transporter, partial [Steroidobacteraceae bacterium]|nr:MFS transporter [Steroidobacteraceae bacterium]
MTADNERARIRAWALYDWANSAFATTVMAGFFPAFFQQFWSVGVPPTVSTARLGLANGVAGLVVAALAPLLGAIADSAGRRKPFLLAWTALGVAATAGLYLAPRGAWQWAFWLFVLGSIGFAAANVFYDALLVDVAPPAAYDRVSSLGYALGYLGGGLLLLVNVAMASRPQWFGFDDAAQAVQFAFLTVALWWAGFTLPLARRVRDGAATAPFGLAAAARAGVRQRVATRRAAARVREVGIF